MDAIKRRSIVVDYKSIEVKMKLLILHLSDIHFTVEKNYDKNKVSAIVATLNSYAKGIEHVLFIVSGDLAFSGTKQETRIVVRFFQDLRVAVINRYNIQDIRFAVVPGNHDVNYNLGDDGRDGLEEIEKDELYNQEIPKELEKQEQFYDAFKRFGCFPNKNLLHQKTMSYGDIKIQINLINTAVFSSLSNDQGFHYLPQKDINRLSNRNDADFVFSVMHHPHHWYTSRCKKELEEALYSGSDLIFVGHEHFESDMTIKKDSSTVNIFAAGELCNKGCWGNSEFHIALLDMETRDYSSHKYRLNEKCGIYEEIGETRNLILTGDRYNSSGFTVTDGFYNANFNVDKHYISKSFMDYFVFPLLEEIPNDKQNNSVTRDIKTMADFLSRLKTEPKVVITGMVESGKTVLTKALFLELSKVIPTIILHGSDVRKNNYEKIIRNAFEDIYGSDSTIYEAFRQTPSESKGIIIDNFDAIDGVYKDGFADFLYDNFGVIIETVIDEIDLNIENRLKKRKNNKDYLQLRLCPFFSDKRKQLVTKVVDIIGNDGQSKDSIINNLCDALTRQKSLYNWNPDFIVQFTKYFYNNIGDSTKNDGNVFSKVFENSLISLIKPFAGKQVTVDKMFAILDKIAYQIYTNREYPIQTTRISEVIDDYNRVFDSEVNAVKMLSSLVSAKILKEAEGGYLFYERSYLAYFTAREIRKQIYDGDFEMIQHVMEYSYMNLNADILLFVTYITENRNIIMRLMELAESTVSKWDEFSLSPVNIPYLTGHAYELIKPVEEGDREKEEKRHIEQERVESASLTLANDSSIFDGESDELNFFQEMMRSISLMITLARALPSFEHLLEKDNKDKCVELIYTMPLRIFYIWASQVDEIRSEIVQMIKDFHEWEYRNDSTDYIPLTDDKALVTLRWESISLLLELMHAPIVYSTRENTWRFLDRFDYKDASTYSIEHLMGIAQRDAVDAFSSEAERLVEDKTPLTRIMVQRVARDFMVNSNKITMSETQRLNQKLFNGQIKQSVLLVEQRKNRKKE